MTATIPSSALTAAGLVGGYATARATGVRPLGGLVLAAAGIGAGRTWARAGVAQTVGLTGTYLAAFGLSHSLARRVGAWPAVLTAAAVAGAAAHLLIDAPLARARA